MVLSILLACATEATEPAPETTEAPRAEAPAAESPKGEAHFGGEITLTEVVTAETFLADPSPFEGQTILVEGRIADVCQQKGCWMVVTHEDKSVRVLMKDHGFSVAKDGAGRTAQVQGLVEATEVSAEFVEHLKAESEKPELMPEKQAGQKLYQIQATAVRFLPEA